MRKSRLAIGDINALIKELNNIKDCIAKTQRERDLKIDTLNKKYESKLDVMANKQRELEILVRDSKEYVKTINVG